MRTRKQITWLLAVLLTLALLAPITASAENGYTVRITDLSGNNVVTVKPGDKITLQLSMENNPGIISVGVEMRYSDVLSLTQQPTNLWNPADSGMYIPSPKLTQNPYLMWWNYALGDYNQKLIFESGVLAQVEFAVSADAAPGDYIVGLTMPSDKNTTSDVDGNGVISANGNREITGITVVDCTVRVEGPPKTEGTPQPTQPKPTTPKPSESIPDTPVSSTATQEPPRNPEPENSTDPTSVVPETTQSATGVIEPVETTVAPTELTETRTEDALTTGTVQEAQPEKKAFSFPVWLWVSLGIVLLAGGTLFVVLRKKSDDDQN